MIKDNVKTISSYYSGYRAQNIISGVINFSRPQASPGYREAANYCVSILRDDGIEAYLKSYPANNDTSYWTMEMFKEWDCRNAYLDLVYPKEIRLADYKANAMSLIQRSAAADYRDKDLSVVYLNKGTNEEDYGDIDLKGKLIFVTGSYSDYVDWAIVKRGAIGIITDNMSGLEGAKERHKLYDATNVTSFSHKKWRNNEFLFGFVLTPKYGDMLKEICLKMESEYADDNTKDRYPKVRSYVDANFYDGSIEDVIGVIPGETDEEIVITAHLCHIKSCANDNASGVAASMESLKTINDLIKAGKLKRPRRTIRMILIPELTGTYAYLANLSDAQISKIKAGINLDMVGATQSRGGGTVILADTPESAPSFVTELAEYIFDEIKQEVDFFGTGERIPLFNSEIKDYMLGSDYYVFTDPTVGVPSIAVSQWPDGVYHTSADTIENIDPLILKRTGTLCAAYAYCIANLSLKDICFVTNKMRETFVVRITGLVQRSLENPDGNGPEELYRDIQHYKSVFNGKLDSLYRFFDNDCHSKIDKVTVKEKDFYDRVCDDMFKSHLSKLNIHDFKPNPVKYDDKFGAIPVRLFKGPLMEGKTFDGELKKEQDRLIDKYPDFFFIFDYITNWIDGKRTIGEINERFTTESTLSDRDFVYDYIMLLKNAGLVEITNDKEETC